MHLSARHRSRTSVAESGSLPERVNSCCVGVRGETSRNWESHDMEYLEDRGPSELEICDRCDRESVSLLRSMTKRSPLNWFKCSGCDHILYAASPK